MSTGKTKVTGEDDRFICDAHGGCRKGSIDCRIFCADVGRRPLQDGAGTIRSAPLGSPEKNPFNAGEKLMLNLGGRGGRGGSLSPHAWHRWTGGGTGMFTAGAAHVRWVQILAAHAATTVPGGWRASGAGLHCTS